MVCSLIKVRGNVRLRRPVAPELLVLLLNLTAFVLESSGISFSAAPRTVLTLAELAAALEGFVLRSPQYDSGTSMRALPSGGLNHIASFSSLGLYAFFLPLWRPILAVLIRW